MARQSSPVVLQHTLHARHLKNLLMSLDRGIREQGRALLASLDPKDPLDAQLRHDVQMDVLQHWTRTAFDLAEAVAPEPSSGRIWPRTYLALLSPWAMTALRQHRPSWWLDATGRGPVVIAEADATRDPDIPVVGVEAVEGTVHGGSAGMTMSGWGIAKSSGGRVGAPWQPILPPPAATFTEEPGAFPSASFAFPRETAIPPRPSSWLFPAEEITAGTVQPLVGSWSMTTPATLNPADLPTEEEGKRLSLELWKRGLDLQLIPQHHRRSP